MGIQPVPKESLRYRVTLSPGAKGFHHISTDPLHLPPLAAALHRLDLRRRPTSTLLALQLCATEHRSSAPPPSTLLALQLCAAATEHLSRASPPSIRRPAVPLRRPFVTGAR